MKFSKYKKSLRLRTFPGLQLVWVGDTPRATNLVKKKAYAYSSVNPTRRLGAYGWEYSHDNTGHIGVASPTEIQNLTDMTVIVLGKWGNSSSWDAWAGFFCRRSDNGTEANGFSIQRESTTSNLRIYVDNATNFNLTLSTSDFADDTYRTVAWRLDGTVFDSWVDGVQKDVGTSVTTAPTTGLGDLRFGAGRDAVYSDGNWLLCAIFDKPLSDAEIIAISRDPVAYLFTDELIVGKAPVGAVTGTLNETLDNITSAVSGVVENRGTLNETLDNITSSASGVVENRGTLSETLDNITSVATGAVGTDSTLNETLDNITSSITGTVENRGTLNETLDNVTSSASGVVENRGTLSETLDDITSTASGTVGGITGSLSETLDNITSSVSGVVENRGTLNETLDDFTISASGSVGTAAGGGPSILAPVVFSNSSEPDLSLDISVSSNGGVSGLTVKVSVRESGTSNSYLDFNDNTFKTSGWTTKQKTLTDLTGGFYFTSINMNNITNLPSKSLILEYNITGSIVAVAISRLILTKHTIWGAVDALTVGKFLALKDA